MLMTRPSEFSHELADRICEMLADGLKLEQICSRDDMPAASTISRWVAAQPEFERQVGMARRARAHRLEDEIIEIADDVSGDHPAGTEGGARPACYTGIHRARLRIEARRWMIRRLAPRRYGRRAFDDAGDKPADEVSGPIEIEFDE